MQLASNLSLLMGKYRYSIQDVHEKTGLARRTISTLYNDKATRIDFSTIEKLCQLFDCGINHLFILCKDKKHPLHIAAKENMQ